MNKIPKIIHYCRFWWWKKSEKFETYINSRKKFCPDYQIIERNENNFDINANTYVKNAYQKESRAFVSDYARFFVLYNHGGIYMDTDIEVIKNLDIFLQDDFFTAMENEENVGSSLIWSIPEHKFAKEMLDYYENKSSRIVVTNLMTDILEKHWLKWNKEQTINDVHIYPQETFYPFAYYDKYTIDCIKPNTYAIHRFEASRLPRRAVKIIFPIISFRKSFIKSDYY